MATYYTARELMTAQRSRFDAFKRAVRIEHKRLSEDMLATAHRQLSGTTTTAQLRLMGHPFARKTFSARGFRRENVKGADLRMSSRGVAGIGIPKLPINVQSPGGLRSKTVLRKSNFGVLQRYDLVFGTPYAQYVLGEKGTKRMVARGFIQYMRKACTKRNKQLIHDMNLLSLQMRVRKV